MNETRPESVVELDMSSSQNKNMLVLFIDQSVCSPMIVRNFGVARVRSCYSHPLLQGNKQWPQRMQLRRCPPL
jgi:hypothetical protein